MITSFNNMSVIEYHNNVGVLTVESRCAITNTVLPFISLSIPSCTKPSVRVSIEDVTSSVFKIIYFLSRNCQIKHDVFSRPFNITFNRFNVSRSSRRVYSPFENVTRFFNGIIMQVFCSNSFFDNNSPRIGKIKFGSE